MSIASAKAKIKRYEQVLAEAELELAELQAMQEAWGTEKEYPIGTIVTWQRNYGGYTHYTFVGIKTNVNWFITGRNATRRWTWADLVEEQLRHAIEENEAVRVVTETTDVFELIRKSN